MRRALEICDEPTALSKRQITQKSFEPNPTPDMIDWLMRSVEYFADCFVSPSGNLLLCLSFQSSSFDDDRTTWGLYSISKSSGRLTQIERTTIGHAKIDVNWGSESDILIFRVSDRQLHRRYDGALIPSNCDGMVVETTPGMKSFTRVVLLEVSELPKVVIFIVQDYIMNALYDPILQLATELKLDYDNHTL